MSMDHQMEDLLEHWLPLADDAWVLAVITHIQGSSYRKPGAMMLFHEFGQGAGILRWWLFRGRSSPSCAASHAIATDYLYHL